LENSKQNDDNIDLLGLDTDL